MKLDEIYSEWDKDKNIDETDVGRESLKIPQLHYKYYKILSHERLMLIKMENDIKDLRKDLWQYYTGSLSEEDEKRLGWDPYPVALPKVNDVINKHIDGNKLYIELNLKIAYQKEKIELVTDILKNISQRNYQIKNYIEWTKYTNGMT